MDRRQGRGWKRRMVKRGATGERARRRGHFILTLSDDKTRSEMSMWREGGMKVFTKPYPESLREKLILHHVSNRNISRRWYQSLRTFLLRRNVWEYLRAHLKSDITRLNARRSRIGDTLTRLFWTLLKTSCRAYILARERDDGVERESAPGIVYYFSRKYERQQVERI